MYMPKQMQLQGQAQMQLQHLETAQREFLNAINRANKQKPAHAAKFQSNYAMQLMNLQVQMQESKHILDNDSKQNMVQSIDIELAQANSNQNQVVQNLLNDAKKSLYDSEKYVDKNHKIDPNALGLQMGLFTKANNHIANEMMDVKDGHKGPRDMNWGFEPGHYNDKPLVTGEAYDNAYTRTSVFEFKVPNQEWYQVFSSQTSFCVRMPSTERKVSISQQVNKDLQVGTFMNQVSYTPQDIYGIQQTDEERDATTKLFSVIQGNKIEGCKK